MTIEELIARKIFEYNNTTWKLTVFECEGVLEYTLYCNGAEYKKYTQDNVYEVMHDIGIGD